MSWIWYLRIAVLNAVAYVYVVEGKFTGQHFCIDYKCQNKLLFCREELPSPIYLYSAVLSNAPSLFYTSWCRQSTVSWEIYSLDKPDSLHCKLEEQKVASCFMILTITKLVAYTSHQLQGWAVTRGSYQTMKQCMNLWWQMTMLMIMLIRCSWIMLSVMIVLLCGLVHLYVL